MNEQTSLETIKPAELTRQASDIAGLCKQIVLKTAVEIQRRKYVRVEGWQSIATAHGCVASARDVEAVAGGIRAIGEIRRMCDGAVISTAEGFVGDDETTWAGRPQYARRAMAQTRAISRACRSAFAHVVVLMDAGLSTTPAEEVPEGGFTDVETAPHTPTPKPAPARPTPKPDSFEAVVDGDGGMQDCVLVGFKEVSSKPDAAKPWTAWFCKFENDAGSEFEAGTFDKKLGEVLPTLQGQLCTIRTQPGRKPGTTELLSIVPVDNVP
jgi:hypothetical protein